MKPVFPKPKHAAGPIEPEAPRARAKWAAGLHEALSQLKQARAVALENAGSAGETGPVEKAGP